ncbi:hypothetical protein COU74_02445 [Candidatus Peregrinibacteria bacterium CG10_big_fil_rev_8_21_14_0_10_36_19]|nr:MAG: hypothetical protein COU74_02445 [Candidatus Peregrinibacteria bacterium CG10_big_fil_rev_8_21_14_0_10_36_19]
MIKVAIVGGGAAGMMAAATVVEADTDAEVFLIEKNTILGRKVIISGGGRCNVTTGIDDLKVVLKKYPRGEKFLRTAMYNFKPEDVRKWVEDHGVKLKVEKDMRVFPVSDNGKDVVGVFEKVLKNDKAKIIFKKSVKTISKMGGYFSVELDDGEILEVDKVILTTGGQAYRHTGSVGEGYKLAESLGHSITPLAASLSAFLVKEDWVKNLSGVSFSNVKLKLVKNERNEFAGPIMFTHKGLTGPAVFALSSMSAYELIEKEDNADLFMDFVPDISYEELSKQIEKTMKNEPKKFFYKTLGGFAPKSFIKSLCDELGVNIEKINAEVSKKDFNKVIEGLKNCRITLNGRTAGEEFVTAGGVELTEVDSKTMESKICPGLYFAGEILNIDGFTGGYNLQVAWCTGRLAGENI